MCSPAKCQDVLINAVDQLSSSIKNANKLGVPTITFAYPSNLAFMSMVVFNNFEIGQPVFAACVAFSHAA